MSKPFPYEVVALPEDIQEEIRANFLGKKGGYVEVKGIGHNLPMHYQNLAQDYYNFKFEGDDVVIMTHPKCGTTWMQEIVWTMRNNLDFEAASKVAKPVRTPFLEFDSIKPPDKTVDQKVLDALADSGIEAKPREEYITLARTVKSPRTIKTHLRFSILPPNLPDTCKVVYVARNPRDACVSYYHHNRLFTTSNFTGDFATFLDLWCRDIVMQGPFWSHIGEAWSKREHPNVHLVYFEDMKRDTLKELQRLNIFLDTNLTQHQLKQVADFTSFSNMKSRGSSEVVRRVAGGAMNPNEGEFMRKGKTGDWKNYFTPELELKFDSWMDKWKHIASNVPFKYEL